jgi:hypothetical protein
MYRSENKREEGTVLTRNSFFGASPQSQPYYEQGIFLNLEASGKKYRREINEGPLLREERRMKKIQIKWA